MRRLFSFQIILFLVFIEINVIHAQMIVNNTLEEKNEFRAIFTN